MKILRLSSRVFLLKLLFIFFYFQNVNTNEPVDIWNIDNSKNSEINQSNKVLKEKKNLENLKSIEVNDSNLNQLEETLIEEKNYLVGLFDPDENDLLIDMWELSDGEKISKIIKKINNLNLSSDAKDLYSKLLLTNALPPKNNFSIDDFIKLKSDWLIKNNDLVLIEKFLINNRDRIDQKLLKFYLDKNLSNNNLNKACEIFTNIKLVKSENYLSMFRVYCHIYNDQKDIAQVQFDLIKENGFKNKFFEDKFNYLMGYSEKANEKISEKSILNFHLSHKTNPNFNFIPDENTNKLIWGYLRTNNLLVNLDEIEIEDDEKIISIEKATHNGNYLEKDLLNLYKRYKFSIGQLLTIEDSYKLLSQNQSRALLYQGYLIANDTPKKIKILKKLKESFEESGIGKAFDTELITMLDSLDEKEIDGEYLEFYNFYLAEKRNKNKKIKFNNKIIHQSKLVNYFSDQMDIKKAEKELNKMLKKIKKNQKYYFSTKDIIIIESLLSDGVNISEKNKEFLELDNANIPTDIQVMINDGEMAMILLRLVEIIGEDNIKDLGTESLYFILSTLNKLNIDRIRDDIILKTIPLKA